MDIGFELNRLDVQNSLGHMFGSLFGGTGAAAGASLDPQSINQGTRGEKIKVELKVPTLTIECETPDDRDKSLKAISNEIRALERKQDILVNPPTY